MGFAYLHLIHVSSLGSEVSDAQIGSWLCKSLRHEGRTQEALRNKNTPVKIFDE